MKAQLSIAVIALLAFCGLVRAEINFGESIEWIVADSERVIVGKITKVERAGPHEIVSVDVSKTIRGKHQEKVTFTVRSTGSGTAAQWHKAGVPMLFCLIQRAQVKDDKTLPDQEFVLRHGHQGPSAVLLGKADLRGLDVFTRDFGELTEPAAILKHVEAYAKTIPADWKKKKLEVDVPFDTAAHKKLWARSAVIFAIPADPALEAAGRRWCKSKNADERVRGIRSLQLFPNEENIKLIRALLTDDSYSTGSGKRYYYVRRTAFEALRDLGVKVKQPVLEEPVK